MRRALVLSGGGSRGAYEIGAWQAFSELGVRFQAVYGTSVGAINAALFAQGDLKMASSLWESINVKQLMSAENEDFAIDSMISRKRDVIPFLIENARHLQVDTAPMEALLKGIAYFFGAAAYFCEIVLLTDCFTAKVPHKELFMAYCFGPMYILLGLSYLLGH